jgi:hypothetical protein
MITDSNEILNEISRRCDQIESSLVSCIHQDSVSSQTRIPYHTLVYREVSARRFLELSRNAISNYESDNFVTAVVLTRAALETTAALWYLKIKIETVVKTGTLADINDINDCLNRLMLGGKTNPNSRVPEPINVLSFVDKTDKSFKGYRQQYDELSEVSHPNWSGTLLPYSKGYKKEKRTDFVKDIQVLEAATSLSIDNLDITSSIFELCYSDISDIMPKFVGVCERYQEINNENTPT